MTDEWTIICKKFYFQYSSFRDVKNIQGNDGEILYFVKLSNSDFMSNGRTIPVLATSTILTF